MPQHLVRQFAALAAVLRNILTNTAAGLITALLLGYWNPTARRVEAPPEPAIEAPAAEEPAALNVDPESGKLLDRITVATEPLAALPVATPILARYGFAGVRGASEASPPQASVQRKPLSPRASRIAARPDAGSPRPEAKADPAEPAAAPEPSRTEENESWMSRLSPMAITARVAPLGRDVASGVRDKAAAMGRAVTDRLGALGL